MSERMTPPPRIGRAALWGGQAGRGGGSPGGRAVPPPPAAGPRSGGAVAGARFSADEDAAVEVGEGGLLQVQGERLAVERLDGRPAAGAGPGQDVVEPVAVE